MRITLTKNFDNQFAGIKLWKVSQFVKKKLNWLDTLDNKWAGKKGYFYGDSITAQDGKPYPSTNLESGNIAKGYLYHVRNKLGVNTVNKGVPGYGAGQLWYNIKNDNLSDADFVVYTIGANDWGEGIPIGVLSEIGLPESEYPYTFIGNVQKTIDYLTKTYPRLKIYLMTPPIMFRGHYAETMPIDFADAILSFEELYGTPVLDLRRKLGINRNNAEEYLKDDLTKKDTIVHPGDYGYERMGELIVPFLVNH